MSKIRVLIVDDSPFVRKVLIRILESDPEIEVVGVARDGKEAIEKVEALRPDVLTLDIMMPVMDGIETLKFIMESYPTPVLILSQYTHEGAEVTLNALEYGAMDFVDKSTTGIMDFTALTNEIVSKIKGITGRKPLRISATKEETSTPYRPKGIIDVVAIGTSTGGPPALQMLLTKFPKNIGFGILIVQHMPPGFTGPLAKRLDSLCEIHVKEADDNDNIEAGTALIAPSGSHMKIKKGQGSAKVVLDAEPSDVTHRPSADVLFYSVAESYGNRSIGVILTGMGSDGAKGIKAIRESGGITFAQDEATSTIFGMPRVAIANGAIDKVLPITSITEEILRST